MSWFGRAGHLSEFVKLGRVDQVSETFRIAGALQDVGFRGIAAYRVWRVMKATEKEIELVKLLSQLPPKYHNTICALMEMRLLQWEGSKLKGVAGTIKPWKLGRAIACGQAKDVDNLLNNVQGGLAEQVVRGTIRQFAYPKVQSCISGGRLPKRSLRRGSHSGSCGSTASGMDRRKGVTAVTEPCQCTTIHPSRSFESWNEIETLEAAINSAPNIQETPVTKPTYVRGFDERWFKCQQCDRTWRLIYPDPPYAGEWIELGEGT